MNEDLCKERMSLTAVFLIIIFERVKGERKYKYIPIPATFFFLLLQLMLISSHVRMSSPW